MRTGVPIWRAGPLKRGTAGTSNRNQSQLTVLHAGFMGTGQTYRAKRRFAQQFQPRERTSRSPVKVLERTTPVAAVAAALTTLACCLPLSFFGGWLSRRPCLDRIVSCLVWLWPPSFWLSASFRSIADAINAKSEAP